MHGTRHLQCLLLATFVQHVLENFVKHNRRHQLRLGMMIGQRHQRRHRLHHRAAVDHQRRHHALWIQFEIGGSPASGRGNVLSLPCLRLKPAQPDNQIRQQLLQLTGHQCHVGIVQIVVVLALRFFALLNHIQRRDAFQYQAFRQHE